ncbi:MAG: hypothetical protein HQL28_03225 [Candidatus Omnitrophica bacterium]|nr:hypothetical protein [Candidatus Omnitrophota bacterium]
MMNAENTGTGAQGMSAGLLGDRLRAIKETREALCEDVILIETTLDGFIDSMETVNIRLREMRKPAAPAQVPAATERGPGIQGMSVEDFKTYIEKLLQGSLEAVSDKISDRMVKMLGELKGLAGTAREAKIREIKEAADFENVDLSKLYMHQEVQSNLSDVGVEEKESKGIDSSLEKLRKLRGLKPKGGDGK